MSGVMNCLASAPRRDRPRRRARREPLPALEHRRWHGRPGFRNRHRDRTRLGPPDDRDAAVTL